MTHVAYVTADRFTTEILESAEPVLVEFTASWCPPCRALAPVLEELAAERAGTLRVVAVDIDAEPELQSRYAVLSVPTMLLFINGEVQRRLVGYRPKATLLKELAEPVPALSSSA